MRTGSPGTKSLTRWLVVFLLLVAPIASYAQISSDLNPMENPRVAWERPDWTPPESGAPAAEMFRRILVDGQPAGDAQVLSITNNVNAWFTRWWLLNQAKHSIDITYFIINDDVFGLSMLGLLAKKAREGVRVRFMLDARGSKSLSSALWGQGYLKEISKFPNVDVRIFNPIHKALMKLPKDVRHLVASNHDKILLVDGEWVLTGGRNISREYFASPEDFPKAYRDTDILLRGEHVASRAFRAFNEEYFLLKNQEVKIDFPKWNPRSVQLELARQVMDLWIKEKTTHPLEKIGSKLRTLAKRLHEELEEMPHLYGYRSFNPLPSTDYFPVLLLDKSSLTHNIRNDISLNLIRLIDSAEHHVMLQNPYIILTKEMRAALKRASDRGVQIFIHTNGPGSTDNLIAQAFFLREWKFLLAEMKNLRIFISPGPGPVHAKVILIDDRVSVIGTYNLDELSQSVNSEIVAVVESRAFTLERRNEILADMRQSKQWEIRWISDREFEVVTGPELVKKGLDALITNLLARWSWFRKLV